MDNISEFTFDALINEIRLRSTSTDLQKIDHRKVESMLEKIVDHLHFNGYNSDESRADVEHLTEEELDNLVGIFDEEIKEYMQKGYFFDHMNDICEYTCKKDKGIINDIEELQELSDLFSYSDVYSEVYWIIREDIENGCFETREQLEEEYQFQYLQELVRMVILREKAVIKAKEIAKKHEIELY